jgi:hypothetical protein
MTTTNPLLEPSALPAFDRIAPEHAVPAVQACIDRYRAAVEAVVAAAGEPAWESLVAPLEAEDAALERAFAPISHLHSVADSEPLRKAHEQALDLLTEFRSELGQHRGLFEAFQRLRDSAAWTGLTRAQQAVVEHELRDFRLSGVALEEPARSRFREIQRELAQLETAFEQAVMDATDAYLRPLADEELAGIPDSERAILAQAARDGEREGHALSLKFPAYNAVITYASDRSLRREAYTAWQTRASDQGPLAGQHDNAAPHRADHGAAPRGRRAARLRRLRQPLSLATKMAPSAERVFAFLRDLAARAKPSPSASAPSWRPLRHRNSASKTCSPGTCPTRAEKLRLARHQLSDEELKPYFPLPRVFGGLFELCASALRRACSGTRGRADLACRCALLRSGRSGRQRARRLLPRSLCARPQARRRLDGCVPHALAQQRRSREAGRLPDLQFRAAARWPAVLADPRRRHHAVPRVRPWPAPHADRGRGARGVGHRGRGVGCGRAAQPVHGEFLLDARRPRSHRRPLRERQADARGPVPAPARHTPLPEFAEQDRGRLRAHARRSSSRSTIAYQVS